MPRGFFKSARNDGIAKSHNDRIFHSLADAHAFPPPLRRGLGGGFFVIASNNERKRRFFRKSLDFAWQVFARCVDL
ncbi:hypothetical protein [Helicobacter sp. T3_23-1056]